MKLSTEETRMYILGYALIALVGVILMLSAWRLSESEAETVISIFGLPLPRMSMPGSMYLATIIFFLASFVTLLVAGVFSRLHGWGLKVLDWFSPALGLVIWVSFTIAWIEGFGDLVDDVAGGGSRPGWLGDALFYSGFIGFLVYGVFWSTIRVRSWTRRHHSAGSDITKEPGAKSGIATTLLVVGAVLIVGNMLRRK